MKIKLYILLFVMFIIGLYAECQTKTLTLTAGSTVNWTTAAWSPAGVPASTDDVIINFNKTSSGSATLTLNINTNVTIKSLTLNGSWGTTGIFGSTGTKILRVEASNNFTITGNVTLSSTGGNDFTSTQYVEFISRNVNVSIGGITTVGKTTDTKYSYIGGSTGYSPIITFGGDVTFNSKSGSRSNGTFIFAKNGTQTFTNNCSSGLFQYVDFTNMQVGDGTNATSLTMAGNGTFSTDIVGGNLTVKSNASLSIPETWTLNQASSSTGTLLVENNGTLKLGDDYGGIDLFGNNFPSGFNTITLQPTSTVEYNGSSSLTQYVYEAVTYGNLILSRSGASGTAIKYIGNSFNIIAPTSGQLTVQNSLTINANTNLDVRNTALIGTYDYPIFLGNSWTNNGTFAPQNGTVTFNNNANGTLGGTASTTFYNLSLNKSTNTSRIAMTSAVTVLRNLTLTKGIIATANNLFTWNNSGGTLSNPIPANSYIATCDASGNELTAVGLNPSTTSAFGGNVGFRIKNISKAMVSAMIFPVSSDFTNPNRLSIRPANNTGNSGSTDITVVVGKGDIGYTPGARINRIWYVHATTPGAVADCSVNLYFTKRDPSQFGISQDEVEIGFNRFSVEVGRKDYTDLAHLTHRSPAADVGNMDNTETSAAYNSSSALQPLPGYYKFSVGNFSSIILPVTLLNLKANLQEDKVLVSWSVLNELNQDYYEVQHSTNGINFSTIIKVAALNNNKPQNSYNAVHNFPIQGKNYYRIKYLDKNGTENYTSVVVIFVEKAKTIISVVPNPVKNRQLNLALNNIPTNKYNLILYATNGTQVYTSLLNYSGGSVTESFNLPTNLTKGNYILKLQSETNSYTRLILIE